MKHGARTGCLIHGGGDNMGKTDGRSTWEEVESAADSNEGDAAW